MISRADQEVLEQMVGPATFERACGYAHGGAVGNRTWSLGGTRVVGEVQGGAARPYVASVELTRTDSEGLSGFRATCTCPVGVNCKHAVALVLAEDPDDKGDEGEEPTGPPTLTLLRGDGEVHSLRRGGRSSSWDRHGGAGRLGLPARGPARRPRPARGGPGRGAGPRRDRPPVRTVSRCPRLGPPRRPGGARHQGPAGGARSKRGLGAGRDLLVESRLFLLRTPPVGAVRRAAPAGQGAPRPQPPGLPPEPVHRHRRDGPSGGHQQPAALGPAGRGPGPRAAPGAGGTGGPTGDAVTDTGGGDHRRDPDRDRAASRTTHRYVLAPPAPRDVHADRPAGPRYRLVGRALRPRPVGPRPEGSVWPPWTPRSTTTSGPFCAPPPSKSPTMTRSGSCAPWSRSFAAGWPWVRATAPWSCPRPGRPPWSSPSGRTRAPGWS